MSFPNPCAAPLQVVIQGPRLRSYCESDSYPLTWLLRSRHHLQQAESKEEKIHAGGLIKPDLEVCRLYSISTEHTLYIIYTVM